MSDSSLPATTTTDENAATVKQSGTKGGDGSGKRNNNNNNNCKEEEERQTISISKTEYDALVQERDQAKINLYLLGNNLKENGFVIAEQGTGLQRLGSDIVSRTKLTPEQIQLMQQQLSRQQQQSQQ